jgi:hypothetical protein
LFFFCKDKYIWKSIAKKKDKESTTPERKVHLQKQSSTDKSSRGSAIKKRFLIKKKLKS